MKTKYRHIYFVPHNDPLLCGTAGWVCRTNRTGDKLGVVIFYETWRKYCFVPVADCVFDTGCLQDIIHFMGQAKAAKDE